MIRRMMVYDFTMILLHMKQKQCFSAENENKMHSSYSKQTLVIHI